MLRPQCARSYQPIPILREAPESAPALNPRSAIKQKSAIRNPKSAMFQAAPGFYHFFPFCTGKKILWPDVDRAGVKASQNDPPLAPVPISVHQCHLHPSKVTRVTFLPGFATVAQSQNCFVPARRTQPTAAIRLTSCAADAMAFWLSGFLAFTPAGRSSQPHHRCVPGSVRWRRAIRNQQSEINKNPQSEIRNPQSGSLTRTQAHPAHPHPFRSGVRSHAARSPGFPQSALPATRTSTPDCAGISRPDRASAHGPRRCAR